MPSAKPQKDAKPKKGAASPEDITRRVEARVELEAASAPKAKAAEPLPDKFILDCLRANRVGDATLFCTLHRGRFVYVKRWGRFLRWAGHHWEEDIMQTALAAVERVCEEYLRISSTLWAEASKLEPKSDELKANEKQREELHKRVTILRNTAGRDQLLECTHTIDTPLAIDGKELDQQPHLLSFKNGVVDLRTGAFRDGQPEDYILNACPIAWEPGATCQPWVDFLLSCHGDNAEMVAFLQRALGYGILGSRDDHVWFVFYGARGRNGKDTLLKTLMRVLGGDLANTIPTELLLESRIQKNSAAASPDVLSLRGKRIAFAMEAEDGQRFAMSKIKWLTGGSYLQARGLQDKLFTTWQQTHLLFLMTNEIPRAKADDDAFWTRLLAVPWKYRFVDNPTTPDERQRDPHMEYKLQACLPGIAAWLVQGALDYQAKGLCPPEAVLACTRERRDSFDDVGRFLTDCCEVERAPEGEEPKSRIGATELLAAFHWWFKKNVDASYSYSPRRFGEVMTKKQIARKKSGGMIYLGVTLKPEVALDMAADADAEDTKHSGKRGKGGLFD